MNKKGSKPSILIVDDAPLNIEVLGESLMDDYQVRVVINGPEAIEIALSDNQPDLILLDIMMPGMDGYEVCGQLKRNEKTSGIPVIFITARSEKEDETKGFLIGAVDYITKPFRLSVVKARIRTHLELKRHQDNLENLVKERTREISRANRQLILEAAKRERAQAALEDSNRFLRESLEELRKTQNHLIQSEKMAALGGLVAGVAHEISTPVGIGVTAASFLALKTREHTKKMVYSSNPAEMGKFISTAAEASDIILSNLKRAAELITSFKQVGADQSSRDRRRFNVMQYIHTILLSLKPKLKKIRHHITIDCDEDLVIDNYPGIFSQIVTNLVINSLVHGFAGRDKGSILFKIYIKGNYLFFQYNDNGLGMDEASVKKVFDPFFTTTRGKGGTGLGMHIVYNLVTQVLEGSITCESSLGKGTGFSIIVPLPGDVKD